METELV